MPKLRWYEIAVSILLHATVLLLILVVMPIWFPRPVAPPPPLEVSIVPEPERPVPARPTPKAETPPPPAPPERRSSDASSEGAAPRSEAKKAEAAPSAADAETAAPSQSKRATPAPTPEPVRPRPEPSSRQVREQPKPLPTLRQPAPSATEPQIEADVPAKAQTSRTSRAPALGDAAASGFGVESDRPAGGDEAAVYDAYLAAIRDKIFTQRSVLRNYFRANQGVVIGMVLDRDGRLIDLGLIEPSDSLALNSAAQKMIALAAPFAPPPTDLPGPKIGIRFSFRFPDDRAVWEQVVGR